MLVEPASCAGLKKTIVTTTSLTSISSTEDAVSSTTQAALSTLATTDFIGEEKLIDDNSNGLDISESFIIVGFIGVLLSCCCVMCVCVSVFLLRLL